MAKYIIDIDALKECFDLLPKPVRYSDDNVLVSLNDIKEMIDKFPKEEYGTEYRDMLNKLAALNEDNKTNYDILTGKGLSKI